MASFNVSILFKTPPFFVLLMIFSKNLNPSIGNFSSKKTNVDVSDKQRYLYQKLWLSPSTIKHLKYIILRCFLTCFVSLKANSLKTCLVIKTWLPSSISTNLLFMLCFMRWAKKMKVHDHIFLNTLPLDDQSTVYHFHFLFPNAKNFISK